MIIHARLGLCALLAATASAPGFAADTPSFSGSVLTIPRVDSPTQVGLYQDVLLQYGSTGGFTITKVLELGKGTVYNVGVVQSVEVKKVGTVPASVYLQVSGTAVDCDFNGPARSQQRLQGTRFDVNVSASHVSPYGTVTVCPANIRPFKLTVPLEVYGLSAGSYTYSVNGITGSFTLEADNRFADDCDVTKGGACQ